LSITRPIISVCLIVKNEFGILDTLAHLDANGHGEKVEFLVVDSSDVEFDFEEKIAKNFPKVRYFRYDNPPKKITIANQRNVAVINALADNILFCDAGGSPGMNWLSNLSAPLISNKHELVGGSIHASNKSAAAVNPASQESGGVVQYPSTANLGIKRELIVRLGGFNESLDYGSDADLVWRAAQVGIFQYWVPDAEMGLDGGSMLRQIKRARKYGKALANLMYLHQDQRSRIFTRNPEVWFYGLWFGFQLCSALLALYCRNVQIPFLIVVAGSNILLLIRNRRESRPFLVIVLHYVYSIEFYVQIARILGGARGKLVSQAQWLK